MPANLSPISDMPDIGNFIHRSRRSAYKIAKCVAGLNQQSGLIGQVTIPTRVAAVEDIAQLVFENIIANRSHYLVGVPYEGKNFF